MFFFCFRSTFHFEMLRENEFNRILLAQVERGQDEKATFVYKNPHVADP